jgi:hypothetical protein
MGGNFMKQENVYFEKALMVFMVLLLGLIMAACATTSQLCAVPEAQNSVVCELSAKLKTTPEMISQSLQVANLGALASDVYTAQQADEFVDKIITDIQDIQKMGKEISYLDAINYIDGKLNLLPTKIKAVFVLIDTAGLTTQGIKQPLTDYDFDLIIRHLQKQKELIKIYL